MASAALLAVFAGCTPEEGPQEQPAPKITSISPASGLVGIAATINGENFSAEKENNSVFFGESAATITAASETSITVIVPENEPGEKSVTVKVGDKVSEGFTFTYDVPVYPASVTGLNPTHAMVGAEITIVGEHFGDDKSAYTVLFDEDVAEIKSVSPEAIVVVVPETTDAQANIILKKGDEMIPTVQQFTFDFAKTLAMGAIAGVIYEAGADFSVAVENLADNDEVKALLIAADGTEVEAECLPEEGNLTVYVPEGLKGDYNLKVSVKGCLPVESATSFAVYFLPEYELDELAVDPTGYIGAYNAASNVDGVGSAAKFQSANGIALAPNGMLWVTTTGGSISGKNIGHSIRMVNPATKEVSTVVATEVLTDNKTKDIYPYNGAFASNGDYYVACKNGKFMIGKVSASDKSWSTFECTKTPEKYNAGKGINFMNLILDAQDNIYVCDRDQSRILKIGSGLTDVVKTIQVKAKINGEDNNIQINHIAWGKNKQEFIVSGSDDRVIVICDMEGNAVHVAGNTEKPQDKVDGVYKFTDGEPGNPLSATIGQITGIYYDEADGYIYFNDINSKAFRVLIPGVGGDYTKGVVKTILGHPSLTSSKEGGLDKLGGLVRTQDGSFYLVAVSSVRKVVVSK